MRIHCFKTNVLLENVKEKLKKKENFNFKLTYCNKNFARVLDICCYYFIFFPFYNSRKKRDALQVQ